MMKMVFKVASSAVQRSLEPYPAKRKHGLRHRRPDGMTGVAPETFAPDGIEAIHGIPDISITHGQRREAEPNEIRCAEVRHHAAFAQRLGEGIAMRVAVGEMAAASGMLARRDESHADIGAACID